MRICIFDSGVGGIGVAQELSRLMPEATLGYLMDNEGFPYGAKTEPQILSRVLSVIHAGIEAFRPDIVVVACNTATTTALAALRERFKLPFVGCVPPIRWAAQITTTRTIAVLATQATTRGPYLRDLAATHAPECRVLVHGAPNLARLAEDRFAGRPIDPDAIAADLAGLLRQPGAAAIDAIALGCTHYAWLLPELRAALPPHINWLDPAPPVARQTLRVAQTLHQTGGGAGQGGLLLHTAPLLFAIDHPGLHGIGFVHSAKLPIAATPDPAAETQLNDCAPVES
jgi:glutamate racemase